MNWDDHLASQISRFAEPFGGVEDLQFDNLLERIGDKRVVLIGEASHGTSEFYRIREQITRELIEKKGFSFVAIEGDWPDAARIDHYVRHAEYPPSEWMAFSRFPTWMWRNEEVRGFVDWLRVYNAELPSSRRVAFHGLDLYSLYSSIRAVLEYLEEVDPELAVEARRRYSCLQPFEDNPAGYGRAALSPLYESCERQVLEILGKLSAQQRRYAEHDGGRFLDAVQNARLVADAEEYYRTLYYGSESAWNLRDTHMFETLEALLSHYGEGAKAVVWAHNSHVGDSDATDMARRGEFNIGRLCRAGFGDDCYSIGFGTDHGTVAAASNWDMPMEIKNVRASLEGSFERLCHITGLRSFSLPVGQMRGTELSEKLLERAIGVIYRPETERQSHYFRASLPEQFDEYVWIDETRAVTPFSSASISGMPDTYPFGL